MYNCEHFTLYVTKRGLSTDHLPTPLVVNVVIECPPWHTDGLKTDLEGRVEKDGWLSKPSALSNVGVRTIESF